MRSEFSLNTTGDLSVAIQREMPGKLCSCWTSIALAKGRHTGGLWSLTLSASLRTVS